MQCNELYSLLKRDSNRERVTASQISRLQGQFVIEVVSGEVKGNGERVSQYTECERQRQRQEG